jgi:hypothetical protein
MSVRLEGNNARRLSRLPVKALTTKRDKSAGARNCRAMSLARFPALSEYDATQSSSDAGSQEASGRVFGSAKPASKTERSQ